MSRLAWVAWVAGWLTLGVADLVLVVMFYRSAAL